MSRQRILNHFGRYNNSILKVSLPDRVSGRLKLITYLALLLPILFLPACGNHHAPEPSPVAPATPVVSQGVILAVGDSLTEGLGVAADETYPAQLARKLDADGYHYEVINAGVSGETSSGARSRLDWLLNQKPDIVILATGGNDGLRGIDPALTRENIAAMVQAFSDSGAVVVLAGMQIVQNMGSDYTTAFQEIYPAVAAEQGAILIPFFLAGVGGEQALNQADGIHPTAEGYTVVVATIYPYVLKAIKRYEAQ